MGRCRVCDCEEEGSGVFSNGGDEYMSCPNCAEERRTRGKSWWNPLWIALIMAVSVLVVRGLNHY